MSRQQNVAREAVEQRALDGCKHGVPPVHWCPDCEGVERSEPSFAPEDPDERKCSECGRTRPHTILRLNLDGKPVLCDSCHAERSRR